MNAGVSWGQLIISGGVVPSGDGFIRCLGIEVGVNPGVLPRILSEP